MLYGGGGGGGSTKKVSLNDIAKTALNTYNNSGKSGRDSNIVKTAKEIFKPVQNFFKNTQQTNKSAGFSYGKKLYQNVLSFDKKYTSNLKLPTPLKDRIGTSALRNEGGGQFSGVGRQAKELYEQQTTYDLNNIDDWNRLGRSRAKGDLTTSAGLQGVYYTNNLDDDTHTRLIGQGENWLRGSAVEDWLDLGNINTEEDLANATAKYEDYERYLRRYTSSKRVYNSEVGEFESHQVIMADAPLPSWIPATTENLKEWEYYKGYQNEVGNELRDQADDLLKEREKYKKRQYKSAFNQDKTTNLQPYPTAEEEQAPIIDSFADVVYASLGGANFFDTYKDYVKEYHVNPLLSGKFTTVIGNHLWNLMDTLDFASRGVRAAVAGGNNLGGTQHTFEGQEDFWATISDKQTSDQNRRYQQMFIDNGGYDLLLRARGEKTGYLNKLTDDEIKAQLADAFDGMEVSWEDVYNAINEQYFGEDNRTLLTRTLENVKETYTNPEAEFNADTGNMFGNMVLETILDPGMIVGGVAKSGARTTASKMTDIALHGTDDLEGVLKQVSNLSEPELKQAMQSKPIKKALNALTKSNESRNIIFKDADKLRGDIKGFSAVLKKEGILSPEAEEEFVEGMVNAFTGRQTSVNGKIIGSQLFNEIKQERKAAKLYGTVDKAIDTIDMAVIKGSFIEPFVVSKMYKGGKKISSNLFRSVLAARKLESDQAAQSAAKAFKEGGLDVGLKTVSNRVAKNIEKDQKFAEQVDAVKNQFKTAASRIEDVNSRLYDQTPEEAMNEVSKILEDLTGRKGHTITDIDSIISDVRKNYALGNDMDDVFDSLKRSYNAFTDALEKQDFRYKKAFLNEVRDAKSSDELAVVVNKYSDKIDAHTIRTSISDILPDKSLIPEGEIDNIFRDLDNGLLAERSATLDAINQAEGAMNNASTSVIHDVNDPSYIVYELKRRPVLYNALHNLDKYPFLRKLGNIDDYLFAVDSNGSKASTDKLLRAVTEAHKDLSLGRIELSRLGLPDSELKQISDDLCDLKTIIENKIDLNNVDVVTTFHLDKQAKYDSTLNDRRFNAVFNKLYDKSFKPAIDLLSSKAVQGNDAFNNSSIYTSLLRIKDMKYSYQRYRRFVSELSNMGISDEAVYAIRNGMFGCYGESGKRLVEVTRKPGRVRRWLDEMMYNEFSTSKVGIDALTSKLASIDSFEPDSIISDYVDEIKNNETLNTWYHSIIDGDPADPNTYLQKQVLSTILMDPKSIDRFNSYEKAPIFVHVSTTGLSDDSVITGISYYKWNKLEVGENGKPTMEAIYNALNNNSVTYNRVMSDVEIAAIDDNTLYSIYKTSIGERSLKADELRDLYKTTFGVTSERNAVVSESDILEKFFDDIYEDTFNVNKNVFGKVSSVDTTVPTFVVHDLDGFNIPFINRRATEYANSSSASKTYDYVTRLSNRVENTSINTFEDLRTIVNDNMLTDEEFKEVEDYIKSFAEDLSVNTSSDFSMLDIQELPSEMRNIIDELSTMPSVPEDDDVIQSLRSIINIDEADAMLSDAEDVVKEVSILDDEAKQIATLSSLTAVYPTGTLGSPVRDAATSTGERIINASDRFDLHKVLRYFSLNDIDNGIKESFANLQKMSNISKYVDEKIRFFIRSGAEEYLLDDKWKYDALIEAVKTLAANSSESGYFTYLRNLTIPQTATESYLVCQKLYDDLLKYWLNNDLITDVKRYKQTGIIGGDLTEDALREIALAEFVDNLHLERLSKDKRFTDILRTLEGEGHSLIFKDVGVEYISKDDIFTTHGKLKEGIDLAHKLKKGYTQIKGIFTESNYLDSVLRASGIETRADFELGLMYRHTADFIDYLEDNKLIQNERFTSFIKDISDLHVARVHNVRMNRLKVDGKINADKLFAELVYNNANHIAFQKVYYTKKDLAELKKLVKQINSDGSDYLKLVEDRGTVSVYLTNKCEVIRGTGDNGREIRYIHKLSDNTYGARYFKPELENISLPTVDELKKLVDKNDLIEFEDAYNMLRECWDDVSLLSDGASNGTLGRVVTARDQEEYYKIANSLMPDLLSSSGLRKSGMYGNVIYDPGFMLQGDYDIFTEFLHTMESQAENFKATGGFVNQVFGSGKEMSLNELAEFVSDADLVDYFNDNSDFVLCTLVPSKDTKLGVKVQQMRLNTASDVATARQMNTVVLPYDMFLEMSDSINIKQYPSDLNRAITKMMIVYKAGALFHPGTWVRNFIDATQKSATDLGQSPLNIFSTVHYEMEAIRDICSYQKALRFGDDFLSEANWSTVQRMIGTDMSYEDFNLLRGMMDSGQYVSKADNLRRINNIRNGGREVISGDDIGLRNLPERDISSAYKLAEKDSQLPMPHKRFIELYTGTSEVLDDAERNTYEQTMQLISNALHDRKAILSLDNAVRASFVPFNIGEITVRFAQMRKLNELGFSHNQALKRVHMTQFRRADRLSMTNKLEYIIPFITFKYNNLKYWMRMMDENPAYFKYFQKLYGNIAEDTIEQQEQKGRQLDYESSWMLKTGGIPVGNGKYYFKINPSFFDAVQTMYGFPTDLVERQNPLLRLATRASMYELGLDSKYIFQELDLRPSDANLDTQDILKAIAPRISKLTELDKITTDGLRTWADGLGPNMDTLYKLLPSLVGRNYDYYANSDFDAYQESLAKDGLWYDSNLGEIVPLSQKNESGMNNPAISWMDRQNFMMEHFNKVWDANRGQFVDFWSRTEGGLNQYFDFVNDPDAWDKLCAEYERKGMKFDYNTRHFIPNSEWTPSGLNNPNLSFEDRVKLMKEKFGFEWDANQNCFINSEKGNHYIAGGLNNAKSFREVQLYRYALFGEVYNKDTKHFEKTEDSKVVVIDSLFKSPEYNNYFAMLGIPRLADLKQRIHLNDEGLLVTSDGKYVLMNNNDYNQRVFNKIVGEYSGRFYNGWKNYSQRKTSYRNKKPYKGQTLAKHYYTGFGWNDVEGYYRLSYEYSYQYHNPQPSSKLNRLISPPVVYPYGGGYNKFSFHNRY